VALVRKGNPDHLVKPDRKGNRDSRDRKDNPASVVQPDHRDHPVGTGRCLPKHPSTSPCLRRTGPYGPLPMPSAQTQSTQRGSRNVRALI